MIERVLVTGGCGFVGINVIKRLEMRGYAVSVLDNLSTGKAEDLEGTGARLVTADLRDREAVHRAVADADAIIHLAAHTRVMDSIADPEENFEINARGTLNLLEEARHSGTEKVVMASTGGAIIGDVTPPVHEEMVPRPLSPYGASKLAAEAYGSAYGGSYSLPVIALRFANVYGPYSYHKGSVVAQFFKDHLAGQPWTIYGDGTQTRDFVYVGDLCSAVEQALGLETDRFEVFNIGSGTETSVLELTELMKETIGAPNQEVRHEPPRQGEIYRNYTLITRAEERLGYAPNMALKEGLAKTWEWFRQAKL